MLGLEAGSVGAIQAVVARLGVAATVTYKVTACAGLVLSARVLTRGEVFHAAAQGV